MNTRSIFTVLGYIFIGALATGLGTGFFLYRSNADRAALMESKAQAELQAEQLLTSSQELAEEANQKLEVASDEVAQTRERVQRLEEERDMIKAAIPLTKSSKIQYWKELISLPLGITLRVPNSGDVLQNDESAFVIGSKRTKAPWVNVTPYSQVAEMKLKEQLTDPTDVFFLVSGQLLAGVKGKVVDTNEQGYALRLQSSGTSTLLIWAKESSGFKASDIMDVFSSLTFRT